MYHDIQHYTWMNYYTHIQECAITEAHMDILLQKDSAIISGQVITRQEHTRIYCYSHAHGCTDTGAKIDLLLLQSTLMLQNISAHCCVSKVAHWIHTQRCTWVPVFIQFETRIYWCRSRALHTGILVSPGTWMCMKSREQGCPRSVPHGDTVLHMDVVVRSLTQMF